MREAQRLKLGGYVRNLPDGSVEVVSEGSVVDLERLEHALRLGPSHARVDDVQQLQVPLELDVPKSFDVR
jgi:acylphosphatase